MPKNELALLKRMSKNLGIEETVLFKKLRQNEQETQKYLARLLRADVTQYVSTGNGVVARSIRGEYGSRPKDQSTGKLPKLITEQAQDKVWTQEIFAAAAGEHYGCHVVVVPQKTVDTTEGVQVENQEPFALYRAQDNDAPKIVLYNLDNVHWSVNENTLNDGGNCFYNALTQGLQKAVTPELDRFDEVSSPASLHLESIQMQKKIEACIQKKTKPEDLEKEQEREAERMRQIEKDYPQIFQQIQRDYLFALEVARGDSRLTDNLLHEEEKNPAPMMFGTR